MRGTGYAVGEIIIFLAIAAIIGFLIGWAVFYRRPEKSDGLSPANPNHVRRLEERAAKMNAEVARIEKRANALLEVLAKTPAAAAASTLAAASKPEDSVGARAGVGEDKVAAADQAEDKVAAAADTKDKVAAADKAKEAPGESAGYLTEADERISQLEATLDKLSEKLAELED
jgi:hypothetical protein